MPTGVTSGSRNLSTYRENSPDLSRSGARRGSWFALGWHRYRGNDGRPNAGMSVAFMVVSAMGALVFFTVDDWPVGLLFLSLFRDLLCRDRYQAGRESARTPPRHHRMLADVPGLRRDGRLRHRIHLAILRPPSGRTPTDHEHQPQDNPPTTRAADTRSTADSLAATRWPRWPRSHRWCPRGPPVVSRDAGPSQRKRSPLCRNLWVVRRLTRATPPPPQSAEPC